VPVLIRIASRVRFQPYDGGVIMAARDQDPGDAVRLATGELRADGAGRVGVTGRD
jgi:hypothetical protein